MFSKKKVAYIAGKVLLLLSLFFFVSSASETSAKTITLAKQGQAQCLIVVTPKSTLAKHAAQRLASFIEKVSGKAPEIQEKTALSSESKDVTIIAIGTAEGFKDINRFKLEDDLQKIKHDGYILKTLNDDGSNYILALGKLEKGAVNAIWRLMRELNVDKKCVSADSLSLAESPFFKGREAMLGNQWIRVRRNLGFVGDFPASLAKKYCTYNWDTDRLKKYTDMLDSFGFNGFQLWELWLQLNLLQDVTRQQVREKIALMCEHAHKKNGQKVSLFVYGSSTQDQETGKFWTNPGACFHKPKERKILN